MNRDIKFRAFDGNDGMFYNIQKGITFDDESVYDFADFLNPKDCDYHKWSIMQFTGLKDRNGVDIYEGDLLAEISKIEDLKMWGNPLIVEFGDFIDGKDSWNINYATTGFYLKYKDESITGLHNHKHGNNESYYGFCASECLIVGNIHQHKYLME